jgi:MerR family transcriptional regulator/heat shock protein HspR
MTNNDYERAVYVISVAAQLAGVHPQTLRNYERTGLLDPSRTSGGSRRFSNADLARLRRIQELTNEGVNLEGVKRILALEAQLVEAQAQLAHALGETRHHVQETHRQYRRDLVPVRNTVALFIEAQRRSEGRSS